MTRYTDPLMLSDLPPSIASRLSCLCSPRGLFREWLASSAEMLVVVALDARGVVGWAAANSACSLLGVIVSPRMRRRGIGTQLMRRLEGEVGRRWPDVDWSTSTSPGSVGRRFFDSLDRREP